MFYRWLGRALTKHRKSVLGVLLVFSVVAFSLVPQLRFDFRPEAMLQFSDEEEAFAAEFKERFGSEDNMLLVILLADEGEILEPGPLTVMEHMIEELSELDTIAGGYAVTRVPRKEIASGLGALLGGGAPPPLIDGLPVSAEDAERVQAAVEGSHVLTGQLVSADRSAAMVIMTLQPDYVEPAVLNGHLDEIEARMQEVVAEAQSDGIEIDARLGGLPYVRTETIRNMKTEQLIFWPIVGAAYFILLLLIFRRPLPALLPLLSVGFATGWAVGLMVAVGEPANMINNTLPLLILVVGVCNAIHVMIRIVDAQRLGEDGLGAIRTAITDIGLASFLTTLTTAIGFASLIVAKSHILNAFGLLTGAGIMLTYVAIIVLLPLTASFFEVRPKTADHPDGTRLERFVDWLASTLMVRPKLVVVAAIVVLAGCIALGTRVEVDARVADAFDEGHPVYETNAILEEKLGGILPLEVDLRGEEGTFAQADVLQRVEAFEADVRKLEGVLSVLSLTDFLAEVSGQVPETDAGVEASIGLIERFQPDALDRFATDDLSNIHVSIRLPDRGMRHSIRVIEEVRSLADQNLEGVEVDGELVELERRMTGVAYLSAFGLETFVRDLLLSLLTATAVIFVVLVLMFRSFRVGLISLLPNLLPLSVTLAAIPFLGYGLNTTTAVVFTITIGLTVDNSIHLIARFQGEWLVRGDVRESIRAAFRTAGRAIVLSNLLLMGGLSMLIISDFEPLRRIAILSVTTISAALVASLLVLPAELALMGGSIVGKGSGPSSSDDPSSAAEDNE